MNLPELVLPWPSKDLSPNARVHWSKKAKTAKAYRHACYVLAKQAGWLPVVWPVMADVQSPRLHLWIDFYPPDKRHRDDDNMAAAFKSGRDGLADALGIDDKRFISHPYNTEQIGGMVKIRITEKVA